MLVSLDIETRSITDDRDDALIPHLSEITIVGVWCPEFEGTFTNLVELQKFIDDNPDYVYVGHNFQFDLKHLLHHGVKIPTHQWAQDTTLMAATSITKIPDSYIKGYQNLRAVKNKELPKGYSHRRAGPKSLKTLAPYFLKVKPFWEDPTNHASEEYVLKDCEYTYRLYEFFSKVMTDEGTLEFYQTSVMPNARMFFNAIARGIMIDVNRLEDHNVHSTIQAHSLKTKLDKIWAPAYEDHRNIQESEIRQNYSIKLAGAMAKAKEPEKCQARYAKLQAAAMQKVEPTLNLDSPSQLLWLFRDYLGYDVETFKGDESTGKEVLQKLAKDHEDIKLFIDYRQHRKLASSFFPTYQKLMVENVIKPSINLDGTRTGRSSVSQPNLQQVPPGIRDIFVSRPGYSFITLDQSAIEPKMIAFLTECPILCDLMINNGDFHSRNAVVMFGLECGDEEVKEKYPTERRIAKELGLALLYGAGPRRIQQSAQKYGFIWSLSQSKEIYNNFKILYTDIFQFKKALDKRAEQGGIVDNVFGRKHTYPNVEDVYMKAFNTLIQSSASDLLIDSARKITNKFNELQIDGHLIMTIHDEVIFEVVDSQAEAMYSLIVTEMINYNLETKFGKIPLTVEGGIAKKWEK